MPGPLQEGERVLLIDSKGRRYMVNLVAGLQFHSHKGALDHDVLIGAEEGRRVESTGGMTFTVFRPTLADFVLKMRRGAQVIYPKDIALILVHADIAPGAQILEAGSGSGSLTLALARAAGPDGRVVSFETREDHHRQAADNIESWYRAKGGKPENLELRLGDVFEIGEAAGSFDRLVLDLPEPWRAVGTTTRVLDPGGIMCCYVPTIPQVMNTVEAMRKGGFGLIDTFEGLVRTWNVEERSVRPDHRMVAHTGFLVTARKLSPQGSPAG